jgi:hypothetical protein
MSLTVDLSQAVRRAESKKQVARMLADLPQADRRALLLDLLAEDESIGNAQRAPSVPAPREVRKARRGRPLKRRKTNGAGDDAGRTDTLLATLRPSPGMPVRDLAAKVYPDVDEASGRGRTRSLLTSLKKQGRVRNTGPGQWEVTER